MLNLDFPVFNERISDFEIIVPESFPFKLLKYLRMIFCNVLPILFPNEIARHISECLEDKQGSLVI
jgi:hypothetical protein